MVFGQRESRIESAAGGRNPEAAGGIAGRAAEPHQGQTAARLFRSRKCRRADLLVSAGDFNFVVEWKASGQASAVAMAVRSIRRFAEKSAGNSSRLVAVPYMGEVGQRLCEEAEVCWLDLSGNAHLVRARFAGEHRGQAKPIQAPWPSPQCVRAKKRADRAMAVNRTRAHVQPAGIGQGERFG